MEAVSIITFSLGSDLYKIKYKKEYHSHTHAHILFFCFFKSCSFILLHEKKQADKESQVILDAAELWGLTHTSFVCAALILRSVLKILGQEQFDGFWHGASSQRRERKHSAHLRVFVIRRCNDTWEPPGATKERWGEGVWSLGEEDIRRLRFRFKIFNVTSGPGACYSHPHQRLQLKPLFTPYTCCMIIHLFQSLPIKTRQLNTKVMFFFSWKCEVVFLLFHFLSIHQRRFILMADSHQTSFMLRLFDNCSVKMQPDTFRS